MTTHNLIKKLAVTLFIIFPMICLAQKKELLIIGTMHTVPNIVKNAYRPLLKYAIDYAPEAIYVEYILAQDTISLKVHTPKFLHQSDSIQGERPIDEISYHRGSHLISSNRVNRQTSPYYSDQTHRFLYHRL